MVRGFSFVVITMNIAQDDVVPTDGGVKKYLRLAGGLLKGVGVFPDAFHAIQYLMYNLKAP
jgi:hypothetical protein